VLARGERFTAHFMSRSRKHAQRILADMSSDDDLHTACEEVGVGGSGGWWVLGAGCWREVAVSVE
jgi:hypothetical protein